MASKGRMKEALDTAGVGGKGRGGKATAGPAPCAVSEEGMRNAAAAAAAGAAAAVAVAKAEIVAFDADSGWPASGGSQTDSLSRGLPFSLLCGEYTAAEEFSAADFGR